MNNHVRLNFFKESLARLRTASNDFDSLQRQAVVEQKLYNSQYPDVAIVNNLAFDDEMVHSYSQSIWPSDIKPILVPLKTEGDGNCLYRAVSLMCSGSESHHMELRARTTCELVLHPDFYVSLEKCSALDPDGKLMKNFVVASSQNFPQVSHTDSHSHVCKTVFEMDCLESSVDGTWTGMWHIYGIASVLGMPVQSIYPNFSSVKRIRPAMNCTVLPRVEKACNPACKFTVMWSRISKPSNKLSQWSPNHFVPCVPSSLVSPPIQQWVNVVKKRRLRCSTLKRCTEQSATKSEFTSFHQHGRSSSNFMQQHSTPTSRIQPCSVNPTKQSPTSTSTFLHQAFTPTKCLPTSSTHEMPSQQYIPVSSALPQCLQSKVSESECQQSDTSPSSGMSFQMKSTGISFGVILGVAGNKPKLGKHKQVVPVQMVQSSESCKKLCHLPESSPFRSVSNIPSSQYSDVPPSSTTPGSISDSVCKPSSSNSQPMTTPSSIQSSSLESSSEQRVSHSPLFKSSISVSRITTCSENPTNRSPISTSTLHSIPTKHLPASTHQMPSKQYIPVSSALPQCLPNPACESKCQQSDTSPTCSNSSQIKSKAISSLGDINFNVILDVARNRPKLGKHKHVVPMKTLVF